MNASTDSSTDTSTVDDRNRTAYHRDFLPAVVGYGVMLAVALSLVGDEIDSAGEWILVVLPMVPALWGVRAVARHLRRIDEYQRLLMLEAMAAGFGVAMITALTIGFVGVGGVATRASGWIVYAAGMAAWAVVGAIQGRRR